MSKFRRRLMMRIQSSKLPADGVYIQSIDGKFYTSDEWTLPNEQANGVAVIDSRHPEGGFVVSIKDSDNTLQWGTVGKVIINVENNSGYQGLKNTEQIIIQDSPACEAAIYCKNFRFPNGKTGYLGASYEFNLVRGTSINSLINDCLSKLNGDTISLTESTKYWTSTQFTHVSPGSYALTERNSYTLKSEKYYVRPFTCL